jgi:phage-related protein (TIGR01555 family)
MSSKKKNAIKKIQNDGDGWGYETSMQFSGSPLDGVFNGPGMGMGAGNTSALSSPWELAYNNSYYFISMNRVICTYAYTMHGVIRTLVDLPVYDAFRGGLDFKSDELDEDDIQKLQDYIKKEKVLKALVDAIRWDRLYGGAGLIINTNDDYAKKFNREKINENSKLSFISADRWELSLQGIPFQQDGQGDPIIQRFDYYGRTVDASRVIKIIGEEAPALARRRLQGWGMSVFECVLREINQYLKNQNVLFELMDEAKIDVYKLKDFNSKVLSKLAQGKVVRRITIANAMKNFANAIMIDSEDDYQQKQLTLSGVAETLVQIRIGIAAATRMPLSKLFGMGATGFSSGEDDIENYNTIVERERERSGYVLDEILPIICRKLFGYEPDLHYEFKPLRVLTAIDEENVKSAKFNRHSTLWSQGFYTDEEYARALKEDRIVLMDTEVSKGTRAIEPPAGAAASWDTPQQVTNPKKITEEA